ncbi:SirB1 family protein [Alkalisalibacterium limincola]|uniref:Tetratricopeptide repeat protein n=1 Tax=Alkalisalibacterium limincola TaxID=2699169 RepID=A0A5C8KI43_9GAMM|nr:tetratricopeptide repeat protein [Alkalisalibacterium limincola]TXK59105.1 tetratricopeptide repeat protein [Alkalisalibacterium limincola]
MERIDTLPDWSSLALLDDEDVPLLGTALLIARDEYPDLDPQSYAAWLDEVAAGLRDEIDAARDDADRLATINRRLYVELGFDGNHEDYYDPRNSYLNDVVDRRLGNPISLAVVQMALAERLGIGLQGVSFPGHFLVRLPVDGGLLVMDPFNKGRPLEVDELRERAREHLDGHVPDDSDLHQILAPATPRAVAVRMLRNLKSLYAEAQDFDRVARSADRLLKLDPSLDAERRDRGLAYLRIGYLKGARSDLEWYLREHPDGEDAEPVRAALIEASVGPARLN